MRKIKDVTAYLERMAPLDLAEEWDNVGLLVGCQDRPADRVMTCLTITPETVREAVRERADLIVVHHPMPFHAIQRITRDDTVGRLLLELIAANIAVYSPHTAHDSAMEGINQQLAVHLGVSRIEALVPHDIQEPTLGAGRVGNYDPPQTLPVIVDRLQQLVGPCDIRVTQGGPNDIERVAVACGSAGAFLGEARNRDCQVLILGEASFHTCLEAQACGMRLVLLGHYASERFAMERMAHRLTGEFPEIRVWASGDESDPLGMA